MSDQQEYFDPEQELDLSKEVGLTTTEGEHVITEAESRDDKNGNAMAVITFEFQGEIDGFENPTATEYLTLNSTHAGAAKGARKQYRQIFEAALGVPRGALSQLVGQKLVCTMFEERNSNFRRTRGYKASVQEAPAPEPVSQGV
jgi:hypothetical protein